MYKKFYVHEIAAVNLSKIYFLKNAKKTCEPNNRDLNRDWITDVLLQTYLNTHVDFRIFSCRVMNKFKLLIVIVVPNTKQTNWLHKQYHARHRSVFTESFTIFFLKCSKNWKLMPNSNLRDFRRSSYANYIRVTFIL